MKPPDPDALREALEAIEAEDRERSVELLDRLLGARPASLDPYPDLQGEASLAEKAWACVALSRDRLEEGKLAIARVSLHSAIDHAEDNVARGTSPDAEDAGFFSGLQG